MAVNFSRLQISRVAYLESVFWLHTSAVPSLCECLVAAQCSALYIVPLARGLVMEHEALYYSAAISVRIGIPSPPSLAGSAKTSLSASLMLLRPVMADKSLNQIFNRLQLAA